MKTFYLFDEISKEFIRNYEAQPDLVEVNKWLSPVYSTDIVPPAITANKARCFINGAWAQVTDNRGIWYKPNGDVVENLLLSDAKGAGWTRTAPVIVLSIAQQRALMPALSRWQVRKVLNQFNLRASVESAILAANEETKDAWVLANEFKRDNAVLNAMAVALNLTPLQLDNLFNVGITL